MNGRVTNPGLRASNVIVGLLLGTLLGSVAANADTPDRNNLWLSGKDFVKVVPAPAGASANDQPVALPSMEVRTALTALTVHADDGGHKQKVFSDEGLHKLSAPLVKALAKAGPHQDVAFAVTDKGRVLRQRMFGMPLKLVRVTTGLAFYRDGKLQIIFGQMHDPYKSEALTTGKAVEFRPGTRAERVSSGWSVDSDDGVSLQPARSDWVQIAITATAPRTAAPIYYRADPAGAPTAAPVAPKSIPEAADNLAAQMGVRLRALQKLHKDGLIGDEEYRKRRERLLDGL